MFNPTPCLMMMGNNLMKATCVPMKDIRRWMLVLLMFITFQQRLEITLIFQMLMEAQNTKILHSIGGLALRMKGKHYPCDNVMASMFLGNDDHTSAYLLAGCRMKRGEYHLFDEMMGHLSPELIQKMKAFLSRNKIERVILLCSDEDLRNRMRKEIGCRFIFEEEKKRKNASIILREWFARNKPQTEESILKVWGDCREAIKANYPPTRECMVKLLDWYDKRAKAVNTVPKTLSIRAGYG